MTPPAVHNRTPDKYLMLGVELTVHLSSAQTGGQFSLIEGIFPPGGDGGLHLHEREDESMTLLDGEMEVTIGEEAFTLRAGESYFAPRGVPQRLRNRTTVPARCMVLTTPGGFERFIARVGVPIHAAEPLPPGPPTQEDFARLLAAAEEFGIQLLQPPHALLRAKGGGEAERPFGSEETHIGYAKAEGFAPDGGLKPDVATLYQAPTRLGLNHWSLAGEWNVGGEYAMLTNDSGAIAYRFHARDLNLVMAAPKGRSMWFVVKIDGAPPAADHGSDTDADGWGRLEEPRMYQLVRQSLPIADRTFEIEFFGPGVRAYAFTFG